MKFRGDGRMDGVALATGIAEQVVPVYQGLGGLSFVYGQGSVVAGFTRESDLDLVVVWDRDEPPEPAERPVARLSRGPRPPMQYHQSGFWLDRLWIEGQQIDVSHQPRAVFDGWLRTVAAGGGWERHAYPLPLAAVAGFAYGVLLADPSELGAEARARVAAFPPALIERSRALLARQLPEYVELLDGCARRGDGWLFHELLCDGLRQVFVAWFASQRRYWPHQKWLQRWIERFNMDRSIADLERRLWLPGAGLTDRRELFALLADRVLAASNPP